MSFFRAKLGIIYIALAVGAIAVTIVMAVQSIRASWIEIEDEYVSYQNIMERRQDVGALTANLTQLDRQLQQRTDILSVKTIEDGFSFLEKTAGNVIQNHQGKIIENSKQAFKETNGFVPVGVNLKIRILDTNLHNFILALDDLVQGNIIIEKFSINIPDYKTQKQDPEIEIYLELALLCKKAGV